MSLSRREYVKDGNEWILPIADALGISDSLQKRSLNQPLLGGRARSHSSGCDDREGLVKDKVLDGSLLAIARAKLCDGVGGRKVTRLSSRTLLLLRFDEVARPG